MSDANAGTKTIFVVMLLLSATLRSAQGQIKEEEGTPRLPSGIEIRIEAHPKIATIGDPIRLDMDIIMPPGYQVEIPRPVAQSGDFLVTDFAAGLLPPPTESPQDSGRPGETRTAARAHHQTRITIAIYKTGVFAFPSMPLKIKTADGKDIAAQSPPVEIEIRSILMEKDPTLKDLKKQAEIQEPARWLRWILMGVAACLLCATAWYFWKRRRRSPAPPTPEQTQDLLDVAETDLRDLLARGLPESGREKQFYVNLSEIVKRILEAGYGIHTAEQTSSEIMDELNGRRDPSPEHRGQIDVFLIRCDVVKFAKYVPARHEQEAAAQDALKILAEARNAVASR